MNTLDYTTLIYFIKTAETCNITNAAQELHISQSTLSRQIIALEKFLKIKLFNRTLHSVSLTKAGESFLVKALEIVDLTDRALMDFSVQNSDKIHNLNIAITADNFYGLIEKSINTFRHLHPNIRLHFHSILMSGAAKYLTDKKADVAITLHSRKKNNFRYIETSTIRPLGVVMTANNPLAANSHIEKDSLKNLRLCTARDLINSRIDIAQKISSSGLNIVSTFDAPTNYLGLVSNHNDYILCLEPFQTEIKNMGLCFRPISPEISTNICIAWNSSKKISEPLQLFIDHMRRYFEGYDHFRSKDLV